MQALIVLIALSGLAVMGWLFMDLQKKIEAQPPPAVHLAGSTAYQEALERARQENKPVLLIFTASWCGPCQYMKKEVYPSAPVQAVAERLIWVMVDVDESQNRDLCRQYRVRGIPCLVITDGQGREKTRLTGGRSPQDLARWLAEHSGV